LLQSYFHKAEGSTGYGPRLDLNFKTFFINAISFSAVLKVENNKWKTTTKWKQQCSFSRIVSEHESEVILCTHFLHCLHLWSRCSIRCESSRVASKWRWAPLTTRDTS